MFNPIQDSEISIKNALLDYVQPYISENSKSIFQNASFYVDRIKSTGYKGVEGIIKTYNLTTEEGIAIMCLAEALLRIPDKQTANDLIEDKIKDKNWLQYISKNESFLVNATSLGLFLGEKVISLSENKLLSMVSKITEPVILSAIKSAMKFLSDEFIIGVDVKQAIKNAKKMSEYLFSFDILGESSRSKEQANEYYSKYMATIPELAKLGNDTNISIKLSAIHPRVELVKEDELKLELIPKIKNIVKLCKENGMTITFDAEEAFRTDIYFKIIEQIMSDPAINDIIGVVIQGYQKRTFHNIDKIVSLAKLHNVKISVRLVKGAYWDSEIKRAQEMGLKSYPVFTKKEFTDLNYTACAKKLLLNSKHVFPQFATHNALTVATIEELGAGLDFEFQKLFGMGDSLHKEVVAKGHKVRVYAPVGRYEDLLAYLMRRLLENGANSSFIKMISDDSISIAELLASPIAKAKNITNVTIKDPEDIYFPERKSSEGFDIGYEGTLSSLKFPDVKNQEVHSMLYSDAAKKDSYARYSPNNIEEEYCVVSELAENSFAKIINDAQQGFNEWSNVNVLERAAILNKIADSLHAKRLELYSILMTEAGKTINDAIAEVREAIDFARYYASYASKLISSPTSMPGYTGESNHLSYHPKGIFVCISPWNFPLAIFCGQIFAALVSGNSVISKPANVTPLIAFKASQIFYECGVPRNAYQMCLTSGRELSNNCLNDERIAGVCFTGSTEVAFDINRTLASKNCAIRTLIAETGGQNCMIVDSSALLEQASDNIVYSAFGSQGQRCSALRVLYVQEEIYEPLIKLVNGAMDALDIGDSRNLKNDLGPVISKSSFDSLSNHIKQMGSVVAKYEKPVGNEGYFMRPHILQLNEISELKEEQFGPILHVIKYKSSELDNVISQINSTKYGLTFGVQSRILERTKYVASKIKAGNIYINRTMIGAQVGTHPFGGEGLSGTGFKAGGPNYLLKFLNEKVTSDNLTVVGGNLELLRESC